MTAPHPMKKSATPDSQLPLPLQAAMMAELPPGLLSAPLVRALEQWCEVLPLHLVSAVLRQVRDSESIIEDFRQAALSIVRSHQDTSQATQLHRATAANNPDLELDTGTQAPTKLQSELTPTDRQLIAIQDKLEAMSDAEYQLELVKRMHALKYAAH